MLSAIASTKTTLLPLFKISDKFFNQLLTNMDTNSTEVFAFCISLKIISLHPNLKGAEAALSNWLEEMESSLQRGASVEMYKYLHAYTVKLLPGSLTDVGNGRVEYDTFNEIQKPTWLKISLLPEPTLKATLSDKACERPPVPTKAPKS